MVNSFQALAQKLGVIRTSTVQPAPAKVYPMQNVNVTPVGAGESGITEDMMIGQQSGPVLNRQAAPTQQQQQQQALAQQSQDYLTPSQQQFLNAGDQVPSNAQDLVSVYNTGSTGVGGITHAPQSGQVMLAGETAAGLSPIGGMLDRYGRQPNSGSALLPSDMIAQPTKLLNSNNLDPNTRATEQAIGARSIQLLQSSDPKAAAQASLASSNPTERNAASVALSYLWAAVGPGASMPSLSGVGALVQGGQGSLQQTALNQYQTTKKPVQLSSLGAFVKSLAPIGNAGNAATSNNAAMAGAPVARNVSQFVIPNTAQSTSAQVSRPTVAINPATAFSAASFAQQLGQSAVITPTKQAQAQQNVALSGNAWANANIVQSAPIMVSRPSVSPNTIQANAQSVLATSISQNVLPQVSRPSAVVSAYTFNPAAFAASLSPVQSVAQPVTQPKTSVINLASPKPATMNLTSPKPATITIAPAPTSSIKSGTSVFSSNWHATSLHF